MDFKKGDIVICKPGFDTSEISGGSGYYPNRVFYVYDISYYNGGNIILWPQAANGGRDTGIYARACKLYTPQVWTGSKLVFNFKKNNS